MSPSQGNLLQTDPSIKPHGRLSDLASKALSQVASRAKAPGTLPATSAQLVDRILNAAMERSEETVPAAAKSLLAHNVPAEVIIDDIVPKAARLMGEEWVQDTSNFTSVTLGSYRLQLLVRELSKDWSADDAGLKQSTVLLWVPQTAQHTLGATVVSSQLRRMGHSVHFAPGGGLPELSQALSIDTYDAVMISASMSESPDDVSAIVETVKSRKQNTPVIVGGTILKQHSDLVSQTGLDVATNDLEYASEFFTVAKQ